MKNLKTLIVGATGKVGSAAIDFLQTQSHVDIVAACRAPEQHDTFNSKGIETRQLDLDNVKTIRTAVKGIDSVLLITGYSVDMLKQSMRVIDEAKAAGVKHIVHVGASGNPTAEVAHWGWHRMIEAYIEKQGFAFTHLQPEAFMQNITAFGWLNQNQLTNLIGDSVWSWIDAQDVGAFAGAALANPGKFSGQTWRLGYSAASIKQVALILSTALQQKIDITPLEPDSFYSAAIENGADPAYMSCVRDQFKMNGANLIADANMTFDAQAFENAVGRKPTTWEQFIQREIADLRLATTA